MDGRSLCGCTGNYFACFSEWIIAHTDTKPYITCIFIAPACICTFVARYLMLNIGISMKVAIYTRSYIGLHVLLNLSNEMGEKDKMRGLPSIYFFFATS